MTVKTGNTLLGPPRLSGDPQRDQFAVQQWMGSVYDELVKSANVIGTLRSYEIRIAALEARIVRINQIVGP